MLKIQRTLKNTMFIFNILNFTDCGGFSIFYKNKGIKSCHFDV